MVAYTRIHIQGNVLGLSYVRYSQSDCTNNTYFNGYLYSRVVYLFIILYEIVIRYNHTFINTV